MCQTDKAILDKALQLPPEEREWLANSLIDSLEPLEVDPTLMAELQRRMRSTDDGTAVLYDEEEADALMFGPLDDD
ncbi:MAG: addiction module protein [Tepidiformaceae bacterium]